MGTGRRGALCCRPSWPSCGPTSWPCRLTFEPRNPLSAIDEPGLDRGRRIDYVLVRCGDHGPTLRIADCRRVLDEPVDGVMASDHYGVVVDLEPRTGAAAPGPGSPGGGA